MGAAATIFSDSCDHLEVEFCYGDEVYYYVLDVHEFVLLHFEVLC